jgi:hypothetical protein
MYQVKAVTEKDNVLVRTFDTAIEARAWARCMQDMGLTYFIFTQIRSQQVGLVK